MVVLAGLRGPLRRRTRGRLIHLQPMVCHVCPFVSPERAQGSRRSPYPSRYSHRTAWRPRRTAQRLLCPANHCHLSILRFPLISPARLVRLLISALQYPAVARLTDSLLRAVENTLRRTPPRTAICRIRWCVHSRRPDISCRAVHGWTTELFLATFLSSVQAIPCVPCLSHTSMYNIPFLASCRLYQNNLVLTQYGRAKAYLKQLCRVEPNNKRRCLP